MESSRLRSTCKRKSSYSKIAAPRPTLAVLALKNSGNHHNNGGLPLSLMPRLPSAEDLETVERGEESMDDEGIEFETAESELQQIFGCCSSMSASTSGGDHIAIGRRFGSALSLSMRGDEDDDEEDGIMNQTTFAFELPDDLHSIEAGGGIDYSRFADDFPRLGLSPAPLPRGEDFVHEYPLPSRAHNPLALNTPFEVATAAAAANNNNNHHYNNSHHLVARGEDYYSELTASLFPLAKQLQLIGAFGSDSAEASSGSGRGTRSRSYSEPIPPQFEIDSY